jgi:hypothetical protein
VLLVDFQSLSSAVSSNNRGGEDQGADLRGLFRDAEMNDAVIFFDECEAIFAQVSAPRKMRPTLRLSFNLV